VCSDGVGGHHPSYVMVWWGCPIREWHLFIFVRKVWKLVPKDVLQGVVKLLNTTVFSGQKWVFQEDSAPAHKAKTTWE
jgi:hypothetical protein